MTDAEQKALPVLHAKYGAWLAENKYGIEDPEIISAIACHTTGKADMSLDCFVALINTLEISADYVLQDSLYMDYEIGDDEKKKHISYQRFGAEKTEQLLYMLDKLTAMMK